MLQRNIFPHPQKCMAYYSILYPLLQARSQFDEAKNSQKPKPVQYKLQSKRFFVVGQPPKAQSKER